MQLNGDFAKVKYELSRRCDLVNLHKTYIIINRIYLHYNEGQKGGISTLIEPGSSFIYVAGNVEAIEYELLFWGRDWDRNKRV